MTNLVCPRPIRFSSPQPVHEPQAGNKSKLPKKISKPHPPKKMSATERLNQASGPLVFIRPNWEAIYAYPIFNDEKQFKRVFEVISTELTNPNIDPIVKEIYLAIQTAGIFHGPRFKTPLNDAVRKYLNEKTLAGIMRGVSEREISSTLFFTLKQFNN